MIVALGTGAVAVLDADDCLRLHVTAEEGIDVAATLQTSGLGSLNSEGNALLGVTQLRELARAKARAKDWESAWQAMVVYATSKGWTTADGEWLIAHVESSPELS